MNNYRLKMMQIFLNVYDIITFNIYLCPSCFFMYFSLIHFVYTYIVHNLLDHERRYI